MLDLLIKSSVRRKIVALFTINFSCEFYPQQVATEIEESPYAVGLELKYLTKGGLLERVERTGTNFYRWNGKYPFTAEIKSIIEKMQEAGNPEIRMMTDFRRKDEIERNLGQVLDRLKKYYDPEKVILFGSAATGKVGPYSDIDLVVIKDTPLNYFKRIDELVSFLDYDIDIDFLVYTPAEFEKAVKERPFFRDEIVKKGKTLYEKAA